MKAIMKRRSKLLGSHLARKSRARRGKNGYVHVASPATATEMRKVLGITGTNVRNALRALRSAGVKV